MCSSVGCIVYRHGKNQWAQGYNNKHFSKENAKEKKIKNVKLNIWEFWTVFKEV